MKTIAVGIGKSFQTVYREIRRNSKPDGTYQPWWAHNRAVLQRQRPKEKRIQQGSRLHLAITAKLDLKWSPAQISRFLKRTFPDDETMHACPETIYQALFAGVLGPTEGKLRTGRGRRKPQRRGVPTKNKIKNMKLLDQRPAEVDERQTPGHWEGDLIIGRHMHSAIGTLVERFSRFVILLHLPDGYKAPQVRKALIERLLEIPSPVRKTLTWDQGRELTLHEEISARSVSRSSSVTLTPLGSEPPTRTPTASSANTSPNGPTSPHTAATTSTTSPANSTNAPASSSETAHPKESWQT